ncbi:MAG: hypothetical protein QOJ97_3115 [Solirubrobacteraceae bacterium]|nr:hypothetical protein [Solirubrobacteraceae bacterium]
MNTARRISLLLVALLVTGFLVAGCGGGDKSSDKAGSDTTTAAQTSTDKATTDKAADKTKTDKAQANAPADKGSTGPAKKPPGKIKPGTVRRKVVKSCKKSARKVRGISDAARQRLLAICDRSTDTTQPSVPQMSREICLEQVASSGLTGEGAAAARKQCESIGQ